MPLNPVDVLSTFDPVQYLYLNPELSVSSNVNTVEEALTFYIDGGSNLGLRSNLNMLPPTFDHRVYVAINSNEMLAGDYIDPTIREDLYTSDPKRLAIIHYARVTFSNPSLIFGVDVYFNEYIYKAFQNIDPKTSLHDLYLDYLNRTKAGELVIGSFEDFYVRVYENYRKFALTVACNLHVGSNAYVACNIEVGGNAVFSAMTLLGSTTLSDVIVQGGLTTNGSIYCGGLCNALLEIPVVIHSDSNSATLEVVQYRSQEPIATFSSYDHGMSLFMASNGAIGVRGEPEDPWSLDVTGDTRLRGDWQFVGEGYIASNVVIESNLRVLTETTLDSNVRTHCNVEIDSNLTVHGDTTLDGYASTPLLFVGSDSNQLTAAAGDAFRSVLGHCNLDFEWWSASNEPEPFVVYKGATGFVGIGTTAPLERLHLNGSAIIESNLLVAAVSTFQSNVAMDTTLWVQSNVDIGGTLSVTRTSLFASNVDIMGGTFSVSSNVDLAALLTVASNVTTDGTLTVARETLLNSNLVIAVGTADFASNVTAGALLYVASNVTTDGTLTVARETTLNSNLTVAVGTADFASNVTAGALLVVASNITTDGTLTVARETTLNSNLTVAVGTADFASNVTAGALLYVASNVTTDGTLTVTRETTLNSNLVVAVGTADFASNVTTGGTLTVARETTLSSNLTVVVGTADFASNVTAGALLYVASNVTTDGTLTVAQETTLNSNLRVAVGTADFASNVTAGALLYVASNVTTDGTLTVARETTLNSNLIVAVGTADFASNVTAGGTLTIARETTLQSDLSVSGLLTVTKESFFQSNVTIDTGRLTVARETTLNSNLVVAVGTADFASNATIGTWLSVAQDIYTAGGGVHVGPLSPVVEETGTFRVYTAGPAGSIERLRLDSNQTLWIDAATTMTGAAYLTAPVVVSNPDTENVLSVSVTGTLQADQVNTSSDARIKTDIVPVTAEEAWDLLRRVQVYSYRMTGTEAGGKRWGLLGQEVAAMDPRLVRVDPARDIPLAHTATVTAPYGLLDPPLPGLVPGDVLVLDNGSAHVVDAQGALPTAPLGALVRSRRLADFISVDYTQVLVATLTCLRDVAERLGV